MKINSAMCKDAIVEYIKTHVDDIKNHFCPPLHDEELAPALISKNWVRRAKRGDSIHDPDEFGITVVREFDCKPFDDQFRGYVYERNNEIVGVLVEGE